MANACARFADRLGRKEFKQEYSKSWLSFLNPYIQRFNWWFQWEDYQTLKELLLTEAVNENIELVKIEPISLDVHASLANAYVMLSGLYVDPRIVDGNEDEPWVPESHRDKMHTKFRETAERAIQEFKIISSFAPDDPWVHTQLAYSYHDLQMPEEEIHQYEIIHKLLPQDDDCLFKLGVLYFKQGLNAQGLEVYAKLCHSNAVKAQALIAQYGG
jgi:tetratricopeptide (TPR) repeat protein